MAKRVTVKLNSAGVQALLKSPEVAAICERVAADMVARLPESGGYEVGSAFVGKSRVNVSIAAVTPEAQKDNRENNSLLKALGRK